MMSPLKEVTIHTRRGLLIAVMVLAFLALPASAWVAASRVDRNCDGLHRLVGVGAEIIAQGRTSLAAYYQDGTITTAQYLRGLEQVDSQLRRWRSADCR